MRISDTYSYVNQTGPQAGVSSKGKEITPSAAPSAEGDSVQGVFAKAAAQRATKIAQLQQAVQNGAYQVDDRAVSRQIVSNHLAPPPTVD